MTQGKIKHWNRDRGFGFIARDDGEADVFVHFRHLQNASRDHLEIGERVEFEIVPDDRRGKPEARNVRVL